MGMECRRTALSEFDRKRRHDSFVVIKLGKPVCSRSLGFIVTQKRKVFGGLRHADTRKERQQRPEKFAELEPGQSDDFRVPLVSRPDLPGPLLEIAEFGRDSVEVRDPGAPGFGQLRRYARVAMQDEVLRHDLEGGPASRAARGRGLAQR